jgi:beta-lactamase class D
MIHTVRRTKLLSNGNTIMESSLEIKMDRQQRQLSAHRKDTEMMKLIKNFILYNYEKEKPKLT